MTRIRTFLLAAGLVALPFAGTLEAQQADSAVRRPAMRAARGAMAMRGAPNAAARILTMREDLKLTSEQVVRLEALEKKQGEQQRAMREQMATLRKQMLANAEATRSEIKATLNDEQEARLQARMKERGERVKRRGERMRQRREGRGA